MDYTIFRKINNLSGESEFLDTLMVWSSEYVTIILALAVVVFMILGFKSRTSLRTALFTVISIGLSMGIGYLIKGLTYRPRPFLEHDVNLIIAHNTASSFPSNHTLAAFTIALSIFLFHKKVGTVLLVLATFIGFSRIFLGHHYPLDVLGGFVIALLVVSLLKLLYNQFFGRKEEQQSRRGSKEIPY
ncbi:undecaprenyl-diphosphatase [Shouchella sp. JSM 1781072]|uniref:undecaprenyl-diphosphatase n=1 Tax=Bacillaceae TaxID=186817 RepID=UPI000C08C69D|nr:MULTISPECIES: undecaprenyl-diphosphatase [Bacillaceae]UTR06161.1 undecaprenyl-diphosphatase [Alkalihalobacillus sp. LMS6]